MVTSSPFSIIATLGLLCGSAILPGNAAGAPAPMPQQPLSPDHVPSGIEKSDWQSIRAAHDAWKHEIRPVDGCWKANNPGQQWAVTFDSRGFSVKPKAAEWSWGLALKSYGIGENQTPVTGKAEVIADGQRLTYRWHGGLEEWFVNDQRGLEHGFTVISKPVGADSGAPLIFHINTLGNLRPKVAADAQTVYFRDEAGAPVLNYSGLKVWDADGKWLESHFQTESNGQFKIVVSENDARYPITIDPIAQQAFLKAGNNGGYTGDGFGTSVSVSGDTVIIGAPGEASGSTGVNSVPDDDAQGAGAAYVFVRSGGSWSQQGFLKASNTGAGDRFGTSVSISGDTVIIGAINEASSTTGVNSTPNEAALQSGAAYVFVRSGGTWSQQAYLKASNTGAIDSFGGSVSISGDTVIVGAIAEGSSTKGVNSTPNDSAGQSGAAYVFTRTSGVWTQQAYLKASNTGPQDQFGNSVSVSGDTVVVGAHFEDSNTQGVNTSPNELASDAGAAYVFTRTGSTWSQQAYLKASNSQGSDLFGEAVAVSGDTLIVSSRNEASSTTGVNTTPNESASIAGAGYVFIRVGSTWSQQAFLKPSNTGAGDIFGTSVAISGDTIVVGASQEDSGTTGVNSTPDEGAGNSGAAYVFIRSGTAWSQQAYLKASNTGASDLFGCSVAVSADTLVVGASGEASSTTGVDNSPNENAAGAGASYAFSRSSGVWGQQAYLKASNTPIGTGSGDQFGASVSISGNTVVIGGPAEDGSMTGVNSPTSEGTTNSGAAYVFVRSGGTWSQQAYLKASNTGANDQFGASVSVSGDTVVVGAPYEDSGGTGVNVTPNESAADAGAAYIFIRSGDSWSQQAFLKPSNTGAGDRFGTSVSVSGDIVVVGSPEEDSDATGINGVANEAAAASGAAYTFSRVAGTWSQEAYLKASNTGTADRFGFSVGISGDTIVAGAYGEDSNTKGINTTPNESGSNAGAVYVFTRSGGIWAQQAYVKASNAAGGHWFGYSVAISGETMVAGAYWETNGGFASGAAYVFFRTGDTWVQQAYLKASNVGANDQFGWSVAVSGGTVVVGAPKEASSTTGVNSTPDDNTTSAGAAYVFMRSGSTWFQQAYLKSSNTGSSDSYGTAVAVSGDTVAIGATGEASGTTGVNPIPNEGAVGSGAVYISTGAGSGAASPLVEPPTASVVDFTTAIFSANVTADGGAAITERGFVYSATSSNNNPRIGGAGVTKIVATGTTGPMSQQVNGLPLNTPYSFRAYATNSEGTTYSALTGFITPGAYYVTFNPGSLGSRIGGGALTQIVYHADSAVAPIITPIEGWSFTGWSEPFNEVVRDLTINANYEQIEYTVTFDPGGHGTRSGGGELIQQILHGSPAAAPVISPETGWLFVGWDVGFDQVTSDLVITALYELFTYSVTFEPGGHGARAGGGELSQSVIPGDPAAAPVITPEPGWLFVGWDVDFDHVTSDLTVTALYEPVTYTVTFSPGEHGTRTGGGNLVQQVMFGGIPTAPLITANLGWVFDGWDQFFTNVTQDLVVTANYVEAPRYNVTFDLGTYGTRVGGGDLVQNVAQGGSAVEPIVSPSSGQYFRGWDQSLSNITGNLVIHAVYEAWGAYDVTFDLGDHGSYGGGGALSQLIGHGSAATAPLVTVESGWVFTGWDKPFQSVTSALVVTAQYFPSDCLVTFDLGTKGTRSGGGELVQSIANGSAAVAPNVTPSLGWTFTGWDLPFDSVTGDMVIRATYQAIAYADDFDPNLDASLWANFGGIAQANTYGQVAGAGSTGNSLWFDGSVTRFATTVPLDLRGSIAIRFMIALGNGSSSSWENVDIEEGEGVVLEYSLDGMAFTLLGGPFTNKVWQGVYLAIPQVALSEATRFRFRQLSNSGAGNDNWALDDLVIDHSWPPTDNLSPTAVASATIINATTGAVRLDGLLSSDSDGSIVTYVWSWAGGNVAGGTANAALPSGSTVVTLTVTDNLGASSTTMVTVQVNDMSSVLQQAGLTGSAAAPDATPFGDGVSNLLKYAFNMNAAGPDTSVLASGGNSGLPLISVDENGSVPVLKVEFLRRKGSGLVYTPERATSLNDFTAMTGTQTVTSINSEWERVTVTENNPPQTTTSGFARIRVTLP